MLEALPAELREQVVQSWTNWDVKQNNHQLPSAQPSALLSQSTPPKSRPVSPPPTSAPALYPPAVGPLVLQIPNHPDSPGIVLELPNFSQVLFHHFIFVF